MESAAGRSSAPSRQRSTKPSAERAHFSVMYGRWSVCAVKKRRFSALHSFSSTPTTTSTPASRRMAMPRPCTFAKGSMQPTTTRRMPERTMSVAQGGVRPKWAQGSRLT